MPLEKDLLNLYVLQQMWSDGEETYPCFTALTRAKDEKSARELTKESDSSGEFMQIGPSEDFARHQGWLDEENCSCKMVGWATGDEGGEPEVIFIV